MMLMFFLLCNVFAICNTFIYVKILKLERHSDRIISGIIVYFLRILIYEFLLGFWIQNLSYKTITITYLVETLVTATIVLLRKKRKIIDYIKEFYTSLKKVRINLKFDSNTVLGIGWFILFIIISFMAMYIYEYSFDGNYYHLPHIIDYIQQRKIYDTNNTLWNIVYPQNIELLNMFFMMFSNSTKLVRIPQLVFSILGMTSVYAILTEMKFKKSISFKCACLYFVAPFILAQLTTTYLDGIVCTLFITLIYLLIRILKNNRFEYELVFFMVLSIFVGSKGTCTLYAVIIVIPYIAYKIYNLINRKEKIRKLLIKESIFFIIVLLIGCNWMIKNYYNFKNPIHPFKFMNISGIDADIDIGEENEPYCIKGKNKVQKIIISWIGLDSSYLNFSTGKKIENLYQYHDSRIGGLGVQWLYFLIPNILLALVFTVLKKYKISKTQILVCTILVFAFCITPANWWGRYVGYILLLGYIGLSVVYDVLEKKKICTFILDIAVYLVIIASVKLSIHYPLNTLLYNNYYNEYPYEFTNYIENGNKNIILFEESYYNVNSLVYLKGSKINNHVDAYFIEEMYPNANVKNHKIGDYDNFKNIVDSYENLNSIVIMDSDSNRKNYIYMEKMYNENKSLFNKYVYGDGIIVYEKN